MVLINHVFKSSQQQLSKSLSGLNNYVLDKFILTVTSRVFLWDPYSCRLAEVKWFKIFFYVSSIAVPTLEKGYGDLFLILRAETGEISELEGQMRC